MMMPEPAKVLIAGDWHGNTGWARSVIEYADHHGCDTIVQVGDFGFWTDTPDTAAYLDALQEALDGTGITLYWVDGNHEDHDRINRGWRGVPPTVPAITDGHDRIWYLPRGYRWEWFGQKWMAVGGAVSVDKWSRCLGRSWWPAEELTDEQVEHCCRPGGVDVIVSHDCPAGVNIPGIDGNPHGWPAAVLVEAEAHRAKLRRICDATGARYLYHGHYHVGYETLTRTAEWNADGRHGQNVTTCRVVGLDCDGSYSRDHVRIITAEDFT